MYTVKNNKGSLSLEAAVVLPLFMFAIISLWSIIQFYKVSMDMDVRVYGAAKELALYSGGIGVAQDIENEEQISDVVSTGLLGGYSLLKVSDHMDDLYDMGVFENELSPTSFIFSSYKNNVADLVCTYKLKPWADFYNIKPWRVISRGRIKSWTGYDDTRNEYEDNERIVYVTESGTVYHLSKSCTYLDLSISEVKSDIDLIRNKSGSKYNACKKCKPDKTDILYITDYGESYHNSLSCSSLRRSIRSIKISQVGEMRCCKKCVANTN